MNRITKNHIRTNFKNTEKDSEKDSGNYSQNNLGKNITNLLEINPRNYIYNITENLVV